MKQIAEALVECGHADDIRGGRTAHARPCGPDGSDVDWEFRLIDPFADTLEGRRQADALEDWLSDHYRRDSDDWLYWMASEKQVAKTGSHHQWRLDRIRWCFEQLEAKT